MYLWISNIFSELFYFLIEGMSWITPSVASFKLRYEVTSGTNLSCKSSMDHFTLHKNDAGPPQTQHPTPHIPLNWSYNLTPPSHRVQIFSPSGMLSSTQGAGSKVDSFLQSIATIPTTKYVAILFNEMCCNSKCCNSNQICYVLCQCCEMLQ